MSSSGQFQTFLFFPTKRFYRHKKTQPTKSTKSTKTQISESATFFPIVVIYAHKNAAVFVFVSLYARCAFCAYEIFS